MGIISPEFFYYGDLKMEIIDDENDWWQYLPNIPIEEP